MQETKLNDVEENIKPMIETLKNSPLYAMSLGGRELYHSNFWAWLMRKYPCFINVFFDNLNTEDIAENGITREEKNHDLTIRTNTGKIYIIENKIKSLATKEQLDRYLLDMFKFYIEVYKNIHNADVPDQMSEEEQQNEKTKVQTILNALSVYIDKNEMDNIKKPGYIEIGSISCEEDTSESSLVLTGILKSGPNFIKDKGSPWKYISYSDIARGMQKIITDNIFYNQVLDNYVNDVKNLSYVVNELMNDRETAYSFDNAESLKDIRFDDTYKKLKMEHFANTLELNKIGEKKDNFKLKKEVTFSNKKAILTVKYEVESKKGRSKKRFAIGIQIEEYQFRYFVEAPNLAKNTFNGDKTTFNELVDAKWFIASESPKKVFHGKELGTKKKPCNKYEPNFIYQYYKLDNGMPYDDLREEIYHAFNEEGFSKPFKIVKNLANQE